MIFYIPWRSRAGRKAQADCPYLPLAMAETHKFYRKQERGRFEFDDLLAVATEELKRALYDTSKDAVLDDTSKGNKYLRKAINGALLDFARDDHKLVRNLEMSEAAYLRTQGDLAPEPASAAIHRVYVCREAGECRFVRHTLYTAGPYRSNHQLLTCGGKVSSKHTKVSVALGDTRYDDGRSQEDSGWRRAKVESDKQQKADPKHHQQASGSMGLLLDSSEGKKPKQRFSGACHNNGVDYKFGLEPEGWCDGKVESPGARRQVQKRDPVLRCITAARGTFRGSASKRAEIEAWWVAKFLSRPPVPTKFGLGPVPQDKLRSERRKRAIEELGIEDPKAEAKCQKLAIMELSKEGPKPGAISWHREAGYFEVAGKPALPDRGVFCRPVEHILLRPDQNPWRRGIDFYPEPAVDAPTPSHDRTVTHFWKNTVARWIEKSAARSPAENYSRRVHKNTGLGRCSI